MNKVNFMINKQIKLIREKNGEKKNNWGKKKK